jgi:hypothetical protein
LNIPEVKHHPNYQIDDPLILQSSIFRPYSDRIRAGLSLRLLGNMSFQREPETTVADRRLDFFRRMGISLKDAVGMELVHGTQVVRVTAADRRRGASSAQNAIPATDTLITNDPIVWLLSTHADCAPIFYFDPVKSAVGISHVGWRGLLAGVIARTVEQFVLHFSTNPKDLVVWVGPTIGPCCFEVGREVADAFTTAYTGEDVVRFRKGKSYVDLWQAIKTDLERGGVSEQNMELPAECTACVSRFGSWRRDQEKAVCMGAVIGLLPDSARFQDQMEPSHS